MKCRTIGCKNEAARFSRLGGKVCGRCYEETDLALPHVLLRDRFKAWRAAHKRRALERHPKGA